MSNSGDNESFSVREQFAGSDPLALQGRASGAPTTAVLGSTAQQNSEPLSLCRPIQPAKWYQALDLTKARLAGFKAVRTKMLKALEAGFKFECTKGPKA